MKSFKNILLLILAIGLYSTSAQALLGDGVDLRSVGDLNVPAPEDIANIQVYSSREIEYMVKNYSTAKLAKIAIDMNRAQTAEAKRNGTKLPARLTKEILSDKDKIADYLRSQYKFSY